MRSHAHFKNGQEKQNERLTTNCFLKGSRYTQMRKKALTGQESLGTLRKALGRKAQSTREGKKVIFPFPFSSVPRASHLHPKPHLSVSRNACRIC